MDDRKILPSDPTIEVSQDGKVWYNGDLKHQYKNNRGYFVVKIRNKALRVHRLIAEAFVPNPNYLPYVNHIDGNKENNCADNLEWCTQRHNVHHALRTGLHPNPEVPVKGECLVTGVVVKFASQAEAEKNTSAKQANISRCLSGLRRSAGGYTWEYA